MYQRERITAKIIKKQQPLPSKTNRITQKFQLAQYEKSTKGVSSIRKSRYINNSACVFMINTSIETQFRKNNM